VKITMILTTAALLGCLGCSDQSPKRTSGATVTSDELGGMVRSELMRSSEFRQIEVSADSDQNLIKLSGSVSSEGSRKQAVAIVKSVDPNLVVVDNIDVIRQVVPLNEYTDDMAKAAREKAQAIGDRVGQSLEDAWIYTKIEAKLAPNHDEPRLQSKQTPS
jgi:osmotically-inducible protein OsmY